jgi:hypothetical protein
MRTDVKYSRQATLGDTPETHKAQPAKPASPKSLKKIEITEVNTSTREDELVLKVTFKLVPSRNAFSRINADLYFDDQKIESLRLRIFHGPLATDDSEFSSVLDMTGIAQGQHTLRVEMYELWSSGERLTSVSKEATIDYIPVKREDRLISVPIIKRVAGTDLAIVTDTEKNLYRKIEKELKKEAERRRDRW